MRQSNKKTDEMVQAVTAARGPPRNKRRTTLNRHSKDIFNYLIGSLEN